MANPDKSFYIRRASPEDAPDLARILIGTNRATFEGLVPDHCLDSPTREESIRNWKRALSPDRINEGKFTLVAENSAGHIVGYSVAGGETGRSDYERELNVLMVDTAWQRQGVGRALISAVAKKLARESAHTLLVGVQVDNPNRAFYERMGAQFAGTRPLVWDGYATEEILYGWADSRCLIEKDF